jgi:hypothetical protein
MNIANRENNGKIAGSWQHCTYGHQLRWLRTGGGLWRIGAFIHTIIMKFAISALLSILY